MVWYYAEGDRQRGPISDEEFDELVRAGRIHNATLIWKDGMETWQPLRDVRGDGRDAVPSSPIPPPPGAEAVAPSGGYQAVQAQSFADGRCMQCGRELASPADSVKLGNISLCSQCDADFARHYSMQQQAAPQTWSGAADGLLQYASISSRFVAKFIDNLLESILLVVIMAATTDFDTLGVGFEDLATGSEQLLITLRPYLLLSIAFAILYDAILVGKFGATLGKMAMGIRVVSSDGSAVRYSQALLRAVAPAALQLPGIFLPVSIWASIAQFVFLFGYLIAIMDPHRRTLYDHIANTRVVK